MAFEKFKESIPVKPTLREGLEELFYFFKLNESSSSFPRSLSKAKALDVEEKCLSLFKNHKDELKDFHAHELKDLLSKLSINCQGRIFHIIDCLTNTQIKGLFKTPENKPDSLGAYRMIGNTTPYVFSGYIGIKVSNGWLDCAQLYEGYTQLRNNHSPFIASLVMGVPMLEVGIENGLFGVSYLPDDPTQEKDVYKESWQKIVDCFETNKEQIYKAYGKEVDEPLKWMNAFLKNRPEPSAEDFEFREGIRSYATKIKLEEVLPVVAGKKSVMKV